MTAPGWTNREGVPDAEPACPKCNHGMGSGNSCQWCGRLKDGYQSDTQKMLYRNKIAFAGFAFGNPMVKHIEWRGAWPYVRILATVRKI